MAYGGYLLSLPSLQEEKTLSLSVRFHPGMSSEKMLFSLDMRDHAVDLAQLAVECKLNGTVRLVNGAARIRDASSNNYPDDTGRWSVAEVF